MVSKCANPSCRAEFHFLGEGQLFVRKVREARVTSEIFWLCPRCALLLGQIKDFPPDVVPVFPSRRSIREIDKIKLIA